MSDKKTEFEVRTSKNCLFRVFKHTEEEAKADVVSRLREGETILSVTILQPIEERRPFKA